MNGGLTRESVETRFHWTLQESENTRPEQQNTRHFATKESDLAVVFTCLCKNSINLLIQEGKYI